MTFNCPFCTWSTDDFDESDDHFTEHTTEYNMEQDLEFGEYSQ